MLQNLPQAVTIQVQDRYHSQQDCILHGENLSSSNRKKLKESSTNDRAKSNQALHLLVRHSVGLQLIQTAVTFVL